MAPDSLEVLPSPAEHLDHDLRRASDRAPDELDLVVR